MMGIRNYEYYGTTILYPDPEQMFANHIFDKFQKHWLKNFEAF